VRFGRRWRGRHEPPSRPAAPCHTFHLPLAQLRARSAAGAPDPGSTARHRPARPAARALVYSSTGPGPRSKRSRAPRAARGHSSGPRGGCHAKEECFAALSRASRWSRGAPCSSGDCGRSRTTWLSRRGPGGPRSRSPPAGSSCSARARWSGASSAGTRPLHKSHGPPWAAAAPPRRARPRGRAAAH
jgi:hypothetical protein